MKGPNSFYTLLLIVSGGVSFFTNCGLKYEAPVSDITLETERRFALEAQLESSYQAVGKRYHSLAYGDMTVIKPNSYKRLDSLYNVKYNNRNNPAVLSNLEPQIENQLAIVQNDSSKILYQEPHWFQLDSDSVTSDFITALASLDRNNRLEDIRHLEQLEVKGDLRGYAAKYYKEEGFLNYGYILEEELRFYNFYKERAQLLTGPVKDSFLIETFRIMQLAQQTGSLSTEMLLTKLGLNELKKRGQNYPAEALKVTVNEITAATPNGTMFEHYLVTIVKEDEKKRWEYTYDAYLHPLKD